ncbi:uncharacterized protein ColSpa_11604 [Colletotrichum spaethianum]|uniref:Celp0028 effector like protein n=1 Tax=Colletotrichum spaethianum TaxID=700344 RepID=A0AA37UT85_9PEZI|nr:uncharacterized protein ColSpa_11604 [Colletotrichum spaethianum]GKT51423.1 hypothetical protein ColSpa_11604 [Colletotrichum spaethianum]
MVSSSLFVVLGLAALAFAAPNPPRILAADDIVLLNHDGTSRIMKAADYEALEIAAAVRNSFDSHDNITSTPGIVRRGCEKSNEVQVMSDESFLNSDVAISPIASSLGNVTTTLRVSNGFKVANHLKIGSQITFGGDSIVKVSLGMNLDIEWSTSQENSLKYEVPANMYGVIVSQPYVRRMQGHLLSGCTDSPAKTPFTADTYESQSYGSLSWVKGVIRLCSSETYPIPYCVGQGQHT